MVRRIILYIDQNRMVFLDTDLCLGKPYYVALSEDLPEAIGTIRYYARTDEKTFQGLQVTRAQYDRVLSFIETKRPEELLCHAEAKLRKVKDFSFSLQRSRTLKTLCASTEKRSLDPWLLSRLLVQRMKR